MNINLYTQRFTLSKWTVRRYSRTTEEERKWTLLARLGRYDIHLSITWRIGFFRKEHGL